MASQEQDELQFKTPQKFIDALEKFNAKAEELEEDCHLLIKASKEQSEYLDLVVKGTVLDIRFFLDKKENMSLKEIQKTYENLNISTQNKEKAQEIFKILDDFIENERTIVSPFITSEGVLIDEEDTRIFAEKFLKFELSYDEFKEIRRKYKDGPSYEELAKLFIYGRFSHQDKTKMELLKQYEEQIGEDKCFEYFREYLVCLIRIILEVKTINETTIETLNQALGSGTITGGNWLIN
jgi:hypothetical protein